MIEECVACHGKGTVLVWQQVHGVNACGPFVEYAEVDTACNVCDGAGEFEYIMIDESEEDDEDKDEFEEVKEVKYISIDEIEEAEDTDEIEAEKRHNEGLRWPR
jgi:hypothetical protein